MDKYQPHTYLLTLLAGDGFSCPNYESLERELLDAIHKGYLPVADARVRDDSRRPPAINGWRSLGNNMAELKDVGIWIEHEGAVQYILEPSPFREWLIRAGRWPLPGGHALAEWLDVPAGKPARRRTAERREALEALLREIERRAKEKGIPYSRDRHPGNSKQLQAHILEVNSDLFYALPGGERFTDELHELGVRFLGGNQTAKGDKFYRALFPEVQ